MGSILSCFGFIATKPELDTNQANANRILDILLAADNLAEARKKTTDLVNEKSWTTDLARALIDNLVAALKSGTQYSGAMRQALDEVEQVAAEFAYDAAGFAQEYPVYTTLIALGILALIAPWVLEVLGFAMEGIVEDSWAALWQSKYAGFVPKRSLFSFFQRLGMTLHWSQLAELWDDKGYFFNVNEE